MTISFLVYGSPQPKGSTRAFVRKMRGRLRAVTTSDNPSVSGWSSLVRYEAQAELRRRGLAAAPFFDGPIRVGAAFGFVRPPSVSAKKRPYHTVKPDVDKLLRCCLDPLAGVLYRDDAQVIGLLDVRKFYVQDGQPPHAVITVATVDDVPTLPGVTP